MNWHLDQPWMLALAALALPLCLWGWRATRGMDLLRRSTILITRASLFIGLAVLLARPYMAREHHNLTVIGLVDVSASVRRFADIPHDASLTNPTTIDALRDWIRRAAADRLDDDRFGLIAFDGEALAISVPSRDGHMDDALEIQRRDGTNIDEAIRLGLAMFPADAARRLVLISDGNETDGSALEAARQAASDVVEDTDGTRRGVPIDVLSIEYTAPADVIVERVETPPHAQPGQTVTVRVLLHNTGNDTSPGRLTLRHEGQFVDLNGSAPGFSRPLQVPPGRSVALANVPLAQSPVNRFEAIFEPDVDAGDALIENNRAEAFTATPSSGEVLIVDSDVASGVNPLQTILAGANIPVQTLSPAELPNDLLQMQQFDLIVLDNVAAGELSSAQHELLSRYVNDLGGGLIMTGGERSFGVGGWKGTAVADILPLDLDPPKELILPTAALVLVLDRSNSMMQSVGGARATQQEVANEGAALAIESLRENTMVGVIAFDNSPHVIVPLQQNLDPQSIAARVRGIQPEGGTNLGPALEKAGDMLRQVDVERKRIVCLSDGQSMNPDSLPDIAAQLASEGIFVTSIAVGDGADVSTLNEIADVGGGEFYLVRNPRVLPRVLVDSVQVINKPLIKEGLFNPTILATGTALAAGLDEGPALRGLVVTGMRPESNAVLEMTHPDGEPLLAHWQAGLGRVAAFTSDVGGAWSQQWTQTDAASGFWLQLVRRTTRAPMPRDAELRTRLEDGRLLIDMMVSDTEGPRYLTVTGSVYEPDGSRRTVQLRQVAPDRYEASVPAPLAGNYIVALTPREGETPMAPLIGGVSQTSSRELRSSTSDTRLLSQIRDITGGRRLQFEAADDASLFDRTGLPRTRSLVAMWQMLAMLLVGMLLVDVASRRVAWSAAGIGHLVRRALRRAAPASEHGERVARTVEGLRDTRPAIRTAAATASDEEAASRTATIIDRTKSSKKKKKDKNVAAEDEAARLAREQQQRAARLSALDALAPSRTQEKRDADAKKPASRTAPSDDADSTPEETTSSLLEARRRAREQRGDS